MQEALLSLFAAWHTFYGIIGSAAATLMGLMFVVITLVMGRQARVSTPGSGIAIFSTPNVVHFGSALLIAALLSAPWQVLWPVCLLVGLVGFGGVVYVLVLFWRTLRRQVNYEPVLEDWLWHMALPFVSYAALVAGALLFPVWPVLALFIIAVTSVLFLFIGIHNAWDSVTYMTISFAQSQDKSQE